MKISFSKIEIPSSGAIVVGVYEERKLTSSADLLNTPRQMQFGLKLSF